MDAFTVHDLHPEPRVCVTRGMPDLPGVLDARVEALWRQAAERMARGGAGRLFNGRVFSADLIAPDVITGHITEFRRITAQLEEPALFGELGLRPLAVCGVLRCADGIVFGRRHGDAIYQAGMWQLPPAGSVDSSSVSPDGSVDLRRQIMTELQEELGLPPDSLADPTPLCLVEHPGTHVCDLGMALETRLPAGEVLAAHARAGNTEYQPLIVVETSELPSFIAGLGRTLVPPAVEFLRRARLLNGW